MHAGSELYIELLHRDTCNTFFVLPLYYKSNSMAQATAAIRKLQCMAQANAGIVEHLAYQMLPSEHFNAWPKPLLMSTGFAVNTQKLALKCMTSYTSLI